MRLAVSDVVSGAPPYFYSAGRLGPTVHEILMKQFRVEHRRIAVWGGTMRSSLIDRLAFALQDETMTRLQARRYVAMTLAAIEPGDEIGRGMVVVRQSRVDGRRLGNGLSVDGHQRHPEIKFDIGRSRSDSV